MTGVLIRREGRQKHTGRRWPFDDRSRDWSDASISQILSRNASKHQKLEEERKHSTLQVSEETRPCWHLVFGFLASTTVRWYTSVVLSSQVLVLCYSSLRKLIQWARCVHSIGNNKNMHHHTIKIKKFCPLKDAIKGKDNPLTGRWIFAKHTPVSFISKIH